MSGQHTQGLLITASIRPGVQALVAMNDCDQTIATGASIPDAQRLAACWNACDGLTQDHFDGGWTARGLSKYAKGLEGKLTVGRGLLAEFITMYENVDVCEQRGGTTAEFQTLVARIDALLSGQVAPSATIPDGWALSSADFSILAAGGNRPGSVTLVRAGTDRKNWHAFADADAVPLYACGRGMNYGEALVAAIEQARAAPPVPNGGAA